MIQIEKYILVSTECTWYWSDSRDPAPWWYSRFLDWARGDWNLSRNLDGQDKKAGLKNQRTGHRSHLCKSTLRHASQGKPGFFKKDSHTKTSEICNVNNTASDYEEFNTWVLLILWDCLKSKMHDKIKYYEVMIVCLNNFVTMLRWPLYSNKPNIVKGYLTWSQ